MLILCTSCSEHVEKYLHHDNEKKKMPHENTLNTWRNIHTTMYVNSSIVGNSEAN
jgi:hypothetical protein